MERGWERGVGDKSEREREGWGEGGGEPVRQPSHLIEGCDSLLNGAVLFVVAVYQFVDAGW